MIISGLGSPSLEDYGLRKWHQIAGVLKCRTPIYGCQTHVQASRQPASLTHAAIKQPHWNDGLGGYCSWRWRGSFQPSWFRTGWAGVRAGTPQGEGTVVGSCTYTDAVLHACFIQSRPQVQSIVTLEYCACVCAHTRVYVCVCVYLWQFHHPHSQIHSLVARSSLQPGCVSNWHSNWQIWMPPLDD